MSFCVYILRCAGNRLYTGYTHDIRQRYQAHAAGKGAKYTKMFPPRCVDHLEYHPTQKTAMARERSIKRMKRRQKLALIRDTHRVVVLVSKMII